MFVLSLKIITIIIIFSLNAQSSTRMIELVKTKQVVICRTDKDGRIVIVNYGDCRTIMTN